MSMKDWVENEIALACKHENPNWDGKEFDYGCACYQSALKAYKSLMEDDHSGMSFSFTKNILIRLMNGLPLRPITDEDFFIDEKTLQMETEERLTERGLKSHIQCPRMSSLFREETLDGKVSYSDVDRCYGIDIHHPSCTYSSGGIRKIIDKLFPIEMPYYPTVGKYKVYTEDFLIDENNGDFDTKCYLYCITPNGERIELNMFFAEVNGEWKEITKKEYEERKSMMLYPFYDEKK